MHWRRRRLRRTGIRVGRLVDQLDAHFVEGHEETVQLFGVYGFIGQVSVDLIVGQISLGLALGDQFVQILV